MTDEDATGDRETAPGDADRTTPATDDGERDGTDGESAAATDDDPWTSVPGGADTDTGHDEPGADDGDGEGDAETEVEAEADAGDETELAAREERIEELETELAAREERIEELEDTLRRTQADFQNFKKRAERKRERVRERATEDLVERLLDVRDNLRRALEEDDPAVENLLDGVRMTLREFDRVLEDEGVAEIAPDPGDDIDPTRHEVMQRTDSDQPEDTVAAVFAPGYEMADEVVRPARVTVSTGPADGEATDDDADTETTDGDDGADATKPTERDAAATGADE